MMYSEFKTKTNRTYLGYCEEKGFVYSVEVGIGIYAIVAIKDGHLTELIRYEVQGGR